MFVYSPVAYTVLKLLGAGYLIYLGLNYLLSKSEAPMAPRRVAKRTYLKILRESVLVEVTNPKTALFFLAFLPQFVDIAAQARRHRRSCFWGLSLRLPQYLAIC